MAAITNIPTLLSLNLPKSKISKISSCSNHLLALPSSSFSLSHRRLLSPAHAIQQNQNNDGEKSSETLNEEETTELQEAASLDEKDSSAKLAEELKAMLAARKEKDEKGKKSLIGGVGEEIKEIEWPSFGKVVGTTGVVLAVIAGSSVALLTVNAILAEISDKVFVGKGLQDFFWKVKADVGDIAWKRETGFGGIKGLYLYKLLPNSRIAGLDAWSFPGVFYLSASFVYDMLHCYSMIITISC